MDDGYVFVSDRNTGKFVLQEIKKLAAKRGLKINEQKSFVINITNDINFLKTIFSIKNYSDKNNSVERIKVTRHIPGCVMRRYNRKLNKLKRLYEKGVLAQDDIIASIASFKGTLKRSSGHRNLWRKFAKKNILKL